MISPEELKEVTPKMPHEKVGEFILSFNGSLDPRVWIKLIEEELGELYKETPKTEAHLKELCDLLYVTTGLALTAVEHIGMLLSEEERNKVLKQQARAGRAMNEYLLVYGEDVFMEAFDRVHKSNMSKLGEDGKPIHREDGKVLKGPNYKKPDLSDLMDKLP